MTTTRGNVDRDIESSKEHILAFLAERYETESLDGHRPVLLEGSGVWFVISGRLDLFAVPLRDKEPVGARRHLSRVDTGGLVLALRDDPARPECGILAVGGAGTRAIRMDELDFRKLAVDPTWRGAVHELIEEWINTLCSGVATTPPPKDAVELSPGETIRATEPMAIRPRDRVGWILQREADAAFLGRPELSVNGTIPLPVGRGAWITVDAGVVVEAVEGEFAIEGADVWKSLSKLHGVVRDCAASIIGDARGADSDRLRRLASADDSAISSALLRLASTLDAGGPKLVDFDRSGADGDDEAHLLAACRLVGSALGVSMHEPGHSDEDRTIDAPLQRIARASSVRVRRVVLAGIWWLGDGGPLLGELEDSKRPVALLPRPGYSGYRIHNPATGIVESVTAETAEKLLPVAHVFYRPLRESMVSAVSLLKFSIAGCRRDIIVVFAIGAIAGVLGTAPTVATGFLYNSVIPGADRSELVQIVVILVGLAIAVAMLQLARSIAMLRIEGRTGPTVQAAIWDRLLSLPMKFFRDYTAGELATRAMGVDSMRQLLFGSVVGTVLGGIFSIFQFGLMFHYSPELAIRAAGLLTIALAATVAVGYLQLGKQRAATALRAKMSGVVLQLLSAISKIRVAAAEHRVFVVWADLFGQQRTLQFDLRVTRNQFTVFIAVFPLLASVMIFGSVGTLSPGTELRTGDLLAFLAAFSATLAATLSTGGGLVSALNAIPLYEQLAPILRAAPEVPEGQVHPGPLKGRIEAQHLVFRYDSDGPRVLHGASFVVEPGEFVAFVGASGSGKSTILRLLLGFETPESGAVYFDGQELSALDLREVRRQMGVVLQNGRLMSGDIYGNIVGSSLANLDQAWEAARAAGFADDIEQMPMGMHTIVTDGGGSLSGGQRQRLLIARALVNRPRIVLFDEATSALDNRTQTTVSESLERLHATRIVIAHRLSTIIKADRIHVVDDGRIVESGRFDELLARRGLFAELARRQTT